MSLIIMLYIYDLNDIFMVNIWKNFKFLLIVLRINIFLFYNFNCALFLKFGISLVALSDDSNTSFTKNGTEMVLFPYILYLRLDNIFCLKSWNFFYLVKLVSFVTIFSRFIRNLTLCHACFNWNLIVIIKHHPIPIFCPFTYNLCVLLVNLVSHFPQTCTTRILCNFVRIYHR